MALDARERTCVYTASWAGIFDGVCVAGIVSMKCGGREIGWNNRSTHQILQRSVSGVSPPGSGIANSEGKI